MYAVYTPLLGIILIEGTLGIIIAKLSNGGGVCACVCVWGGGYAVHHYSEVVEDTLYTITGKLSMEGTLYTITCKLSMEGTLYTITCKFSMEGTLYTITCKFSIEGTLYTFTCKLSMKGTHTCNHY